MDGIYRRSDGLCLENEAEVWERIEKLPIVLCHRDFWVTNILCKDKIKLGDEYVGLIGGGLEADGASGLIEPIMVDHRHQKRGIAEQALKLMAQYLASHFSVDRVYIEHKRDNHAAAHVFEKAGFKVVGEDEESFRRCMRVEKHGMAGNILNKDYLMKHWYANIYDRHEVVDDGVRHILSTVESISSGKALNILEVACGGGRIAIPLAQAGHSVTGFDIDEFMLARIPHKTDCLPNFKYYKSDAVTNGNGCDVVILSGNVLVNIVAESDYRQAQELFIQKAASCVKQGGHLYLDFTCPNWPDSSPEESEERVIFEGTDDLGTYGKFILVEGEYDSRTRIDKSERRYEITPIGGEAFPVTVPMFKHFPKYEQVLSWLVYF